MYQGNPKIPRTQPVSDSLRPDQIDAIARQVQQKLQIKPTHFDIAKDDQDESMEDDRVTRMEERLAQLETTVHSQHTQQVIQNQELNGKINTLHSQMEQQQTSLQQHFDNKTSEQLMHIERLLAASNEASAAKQPRLE